MYPAPVYSVKQMNLARVIKPKYVIPMHYNTNPFNRGTAEEMIKAPGTTQIKVIAAKPGDKVEF
jgi:L-ascorbate metabolism protein UlaG (beta-lactamase superfamily)